MMATVVFNNETRVRKNSPAAQMKPRKHSANLHQQHHQQNERRQPTFGICFDVDGVLARGTDAIPAAVTGFKRLVDDNGKFRVPVAFVTNSLSRNCDKAAHLSNILGVQVTPDQCIHSPGPLELFTDLHERHCLIVGQGKVMDIADDLGFKNVCTVEEIADAFPLLDMVDHDNRRKIATQGYVEKEFPRVEAIILLGEPKRWESALQILVDVLRSDGRPNQPPTLPSGRQIPVIACNMDLQFQHSAPMPRYGHGAFLVCLEALFKKVTGRELQYTALIGKPSEITYRYAEHVLTSQSHKLGFDAPIRTMYLIGDTPDSDIAGTNLYQQYVDRMAPIRVRNQLENLVGEEPSKELEDCYDAELPASRKVPVSATFHRQTVDTAIPILVRTGVYRDPVPSSSSETNCYDIRGSLSTSSSVASFTGGDEDDYSSDESVESHGHRDFPNNADLKKPERICDDVDVAIEHILNRHRFL